MKFLTPLALLATTLLSSSAYAALDLCDSNKELFSHEHNSFYFPTGISNAENEVCVDIRGKFKTEIPLINSKVKFFARRGDLEKDWEVDVYATMKQPANSEWPIRSGFNDKIRLCTFHNSDFKYITNKDINFKVMVTRPDGQVVICLSGPLHLD
ncbi:hypothetical protein FBU30_003320 [Linnemannia zychae]|nr:hypothetical protein FBU30_003320 [Linnemannia zychae]